MATRGRRATPAALALVTGSKNAQAVQPGHAAAEVEATLSPMVRPHPTWFSPEHKAEWDYIVENAPLGLLKSVDYNNLLAHVVAIVEHGRAARLLRVEPMLEETPNGHMQASPYYGIMNRQAEIMVRTAAEMGFTPSSRVRVAQSVTNPKKPKAVDDPKKEFFG